jgi:hypothetical protein
MTKPRNNDSGDLSRIRQEAEKLQARSSRSTSPPDRRQSPADGPGASHAARRSAAPTPGAPRERAWFEPSGPRAGAGAAGGRAPRGRVD